MKPHKRILLIILGLLLAGTGAGLVVTSDWGSRAVSPGGPQPGGPQSPVDMHQMQTAMALAPLAVSAEEQERARDALRLADHEVDMEFAAALREATSQPVPSTPEIRAILERKSKAGSRAATRARKSAAGTERRRTRRRGPGFGARRRRPPKPHPAHGRRPQRRPTRSQRRTGPQCGGKTGGSDPARFEFVFSART